MDDLSLAPLIKPSAEYGVVLIDATDSITGAQNRFTIKGKHMCSYIEKILSQICSDSVKNFDLKRTVHYLRKHYPLLNLRPITNSSSFPIKA
jgi:ribose 5-phosphate isomerase